MEICELFNYMGINMHECLCLYCVADPKFEYSRYFHLVVNIAKIFQKLRLLPKTAFF